MLLCTVRQCRQPLARPQPDARRLVCARGHSFDIARSGYINLLQPQDRRSRHPGDSAAVVAARRRLHDRGFTAPLAQAIGGLLRATPKDSVLDAGCGDGFYLGTLAAEFGFAAHGVDVSVPAITAAAKRYPDCGWVVANADRFLPYADGSFSAVLSITGRMNPAEFRRVLRADGRLLVALAAPGDLMELRGAAARGSKSRAAQSEEETHSPKAGRDRVPRTVAEFEPHFLLIDQRRATTHAQLERAAIQDVLVSIYRPITRHRPEALPPRHEPSPPPEAMRCTFSLDLLLFQPR